MSSRPPKAGTPFPPELATRLAEETAKSLTAETGSDRYATVLDALAYSPVRGQVVPEGIPAEPTDELLAALKKLASRLPKIAALFGIEAPAAPGQGPRPTQGQGPGPPSPPAASSRPRLPAASAPSRRPRATSPPSCLPVTRRLRPSTPETRPPEALDAGEQPVAAIEAPSRRHLPPSPRPPPPSPWPRHRRARPRRRARGAGRGGHGRSGRSPSPRHRPRRHRRLQPRLLPTSPRP